MENGFVMNGDRFWLIKVYLKVYRVQPVLFDYDDWEHLEAGNLGTTTYTTFD